LSHAKQALLLPSGLEAGNQHRTSYEEPMSLLENWIKGLLLCVATKRVQSSWQYQLGLVKQQP